MNIPLGYEVGSGKPVNIPLRHMAVTGQTQRSGKTTTLEALITRSGLRSIAFLTKRGEQPFSIGRPILPFFKDAGDWQYVESIIEASLKEKNKFQRAWVQKACKGAKSLADVQKNTKRLMKQSTRSMDQDQFMLLDSYFDIVVPQIARLPKSPTLTLGTGLSMMDLTGFTTEMQMLIVRSSIEWVHKHEQGVITIIPEAWKFVPEGKGSPVKNAATSLVREGAALKNFIWLDAQDIRGVDKVILGGCTVWIMGVQRERNEVDRVLENIPGNTIRPEQIQKLGIGQFYASFDESLHKTYVQPAWMPDDVAIDVAKGKIKANEVARFRAEPTSPKHVRMVPAFPETDHVAVAREQAFQALKTKTPSPTEGTEDMAVEAKLDQLIELMARQQGGQASQAPPPAQSYADPGEDAMFDRFKKRLIAEAPQILRTILDKPEIHVKVEKVVIEADKSVKGRVVLLISEGFFKEPRPSIDVCRDFDRRGWAYANIQIGKALSELTTAGAMYKIDKTYQQVPGIKIVNI